MEKEILTGIMIKEIFKNTEISFDRIRGSVNCEVQFCNLRISRHLYNKILFEANEFSNSHIDEFISKYDNPYICFCFDILFKGCKFDKNISNRLIVEDMSITGCHYGFECYISYDNECEFDGVPMVCPENGEFTGYKYVLLTKPDDETHVAKFAILKLLIPEDAKRVSGFSNKCRCSKAMAVGLYSIKDLESITLDDGTEIVSVNDPKFKYKIGKMAIPDGFTESRWITCGHGIHFFMTAKEAAEDVYA